MKKKIKRIETKEKQRWGRKDIDIGEFQLFRKMDFYKTQPYFDSDMCGLV